MTRKNWERGDAFALGVFLNGAEITERTPAGEDVVDDSFLVLFNGWRDAVSFRLPPVRFGRRWSHELSTAEPDLPPDGDERRARDEVEVPAHAVVVLRRSR